MAAATMSSNGIMPMDSESEDRAPSGMIYPPPDTRRTIDKAAQMLAQKADHAALTARIINDNENTGKFNFLKPGDPLHPYYQSKLLEFRKGEKATTAESSTIDAPTAVDNEPKAPKEPQPYAFFLRPFSGDPVDLDIIKLTAQFAARYGNTFTNEIAKREHKNYQFDFLRPSHSLFLFYSELVKQYIRTLAPPNEMKEKLAKVAESQHCILEQAKERAEWKKWVKDEEKKNNEEKERRKALYESYDWHDFVVVGTVEFTAADEGNTLPPPMSIFELQNMSLEQKRMAFGSQYEEEEMAPDTEMGLEGEMEEEVPPAPRPTPAIIPQNVAGSIKIRTDYKPKLGAAKAKEGTQICPRCGEKIPLSEMEEHVRIELLDPKWKEQKGAMLAKNKDSNLLQEGTDVSKILQDFSEHRSDIFGADQAEIEKRNAKAREAQEKAKQREKEIWDGHSSSASQTRAAARANPIDEKIAAIHKSHGFAEEAMPYGADPVYQAPVQNYYGAFSNQIPGPYPPGLPPMGYPPTIRKAENGHEGQPGSKRGRFDPSAPVPPNQPTNNNNNDNNTNHQ